MFNLEIISLITIRSIKFNILQFNKAILEQQLQLPLFYTDWKQSHSRSILCLAVMATEEIDSKYHGTGHT